MSLKDKSMKPKTQIKEMMTSDLRTLAEDRFVEEIYNEGFENIWGIIWMELKRKLLMELRRANQ